MADMAAAKKWVDEEFQPSTLSKKEQLKEMEWFIKAAKPFKGHEHQGRLRNHSDP
jgi:glycerol transport system substrate-binding protein